MLIQHHSIRWVPLLLPFILSGSSALDLWREEIQQRTGARILLVRVYPQPERNEAPAVALRYLADDSLRRELAMAHALTVNHQGPEGKAHIILMNMRLADQWKGAEDGLLAHETGHIWLDSIGLRSPQYQAGPRACVAIHSGDIPQHVLIRSEAERRGVSTKPYLLSNLQLLLGALESGAAPKVLAPCQRLVMLSQLLDARLGLTDAEWPERDRLLLALQSAYPELAPHADAIEERLRGVRLDDLDSFVCAVQFTRGRLEQLFGR